MLYWATRNRGGVSAALSSVADKDNMWLVNFAHLNALSVLEESSPVRPGGKWRAYAGGPKAVQVRIALKMQVRTRVGLARVMLREVWGAPMVLCQWCMLGRALREGGVRNSLAAPANGARFRHSSVERLVFWSDWYFEAMRAPVHSTCSYRRVENSTISGNLHSLTEYAGAPTRSPHSIMSPLCSSESSPFNKKTR